MGPAASIAGIHPKKISGNVGSIIIAIGILLKKFNAISGRLLLNSAALSSFISNEVITVIGYSPTVRPQTDNVILNSPASSGSHVYWRTFSATITSLTATQPFVPKLTVRLFPVSSTLPADFVSLSNETTFASVYL